MKYWMMALMMVLSACAVLNKEGARVKVVRDRSQIGDKCRALGAVKLGFGQGVGLGQADNNVDRMRNLTAKMGGNVLVSDHHSDFKSPAARPITAPSK
jgi:hypothetical protein